MAVLLILDTSGEYCSATLIVHQRVFTKNAPAVLQHGRMLLNFCKEVLSQAGLTLSDLSAIGFVKGPGSYTGVRIAASAAQAIGTVLNLKIIALPAGKKYEKYELYQQEYLAPLACEYWQKNRLIFPQEAEPVYLNDIYD